MNPQLPKVATAIRAIYDNIEPGVAFPNAARILSREGFGTILLTHEEALLYGEATQELLACYGREGELSKHASDAALRDALFDAIGGFGADPTGFEDRLRSALVKLHGRLSAPPVEYTCFFELGGARSTGLPYTFGATRIVRFNDSQLRQFRNSQGRLPADTPAHAGTELRRIREASIWMAPVVRVRANGKDASAAQRAGEQDVRRTIDVLNFFGGLLPYSHGHLFLPGDAARTTRIVPILSPREQWTLSYSVTGPAGLFDFAKIRTAKRARPGLAYAHRLLGKPSPFALDTILITALQWAGRATASARRDQAFLSYAIALESAVLPTRDPLELGYRLRTRVAHLIGGEKMKRRRISKRVTALYATRSEIVHNGLYEISNQELTAIRGLCQTVLLKLLSNRQVRQFRAPGQLQEWFDDRAMG